MQSLAIEEMPKEGALPKRLVVKFWGLVRAQALMGRTCQDSMHGIQGGGSDVGYTAETWHGLGCCKGAWYFEVLGDK